MAKKINTTRLGIFVLIGFCLAIVAITLFGSGRMFKRLERYVIFFPESVRGLQVGSPVRFRGIQLGTVVEMQALFRPEENKIIIPVYIEIERARIRNLGLAAKARKEQQDNLLKAGIRAQLVTDSIVTGQRSISLDFRSEAPVRLVGVDTSVPEIASVPSPLEELTETIQNLPLEEIVRNFNGTLAAIKEVMTNPGFVEGMETIGPTLVAAREAMEMISKEMQPLLVELQTKVKGFDIEKLDQSLTSIKIAAANLAALTAKGAPLDSNANRALDEVAAAARELRQVAELIQRRPEVLLKGK